MVWFIVEGFLSSVEDLNCCFCVVSGCLMNNKNNETKTSICNIIVITVRFKNFITCCGVLAEETLCGLTDSGKTYFLRRKICEFRKCTLLTANLPIIIQVLQIK